MPAQPTRTRECKVVLLGDTGVGKSSLAQRYVTNTFKPYSESTIGASFMSKMILVDGAPCKCQIWDTAGQEKYHERRRQKQTSNLSSSVKSKSIRLIFGRIDCSHRVLEAQPMSTAQSVQLRAH